MKMSEANPIEDLVQAALEKNYSTATDIFNDTIGQKMQAALDQEKIAIADRIYNGVEPEDEEIDDEDLDISDEDFEVDEDEEIDDEEDLED
jgi:hypothetical protein